MGIPGTVPITAPVAPTSLVDVYPSHIAEYGKGGYMVVDDIAARNAITTERRTSGMLVYVKSNTYVYRLGTGGTNSDWVVAIATSGIFVSNDLSSMRSIESNSGNRLCILLGYSSMGDGSGGIYFWDASSNAADSPMSVIRPSDFVSVGVWKQLY